MSAVDTFVEAGAVRIHALDRPGDAPALVLLPGLTANSHAFDGLVDAGLSPRFRTLALDLRGRGQSEQPPAGYGMAEHAADVVAVLDALSLRSVVLVGHSFGGFVSLYLASHYAARVERLVLLDVGFAMASTRTREQIKPSVDRLGQVWPSWEAYLAAIKASPAYSGWWEPAIESYYRADVCDNPDGSIKPRSRPATIEAAMDGLLAEPWREHAAAVRQPVLLVHAPGAYGAAGAPPILETESAHETVAALADARYVSVPGNHMTMLYGAGARRIVEAIAAFVDGGQRTPGGEP